MTSLSISNTRLISNDDTIYNNFLKTSKDLSEKFHKVLTNPIESLVKPLIANTIQSAQAESLDPTQTLQLKIDQKNSDGEIAIPPGNYGSINVNRNLGLIAADDNHPPHIQRINAINVSKFYVNNISVGNNNLTADEVRNLPESETGIRVVIKNDKNAEQVDIGINNSRISGVADGISISSAHPTKNTENQRITISGNTISNIQRDGIILKNVGQYAITRNTIHSIHPNYENTLYTDLRKVNNEPDAAVILPNGTMAQHADGIQVANAKGGTISGNKLSIGNGTWYQAINVHHEQDSPYRNLETEPVRIQNNTIQNNHDFAISAQHFGSVYENSNILNTVENKKRNRVERMQILIK